MADSPFHYRPDAAESAWIAPRIDALAAAVAALPGGSPLLPDVEIALKAVRWTIRFGEFIGKADVSRTLRALDLGDRRAALLVRGEHPWTTATGNVERGYRSKVDGSIQPYRVVVPKGYDDQSRTRLDVILHGRDNTLSEVRFLDRFSREESAGLLLHVYGRGNNAYRWAGETDVFEAIEAVSKHYRVDDARILLRGFSMGGAGAWHLGLHHPDRWAAVEAGAGFTETRKYLKLGAIPDYQAKTLTIYDALDVAGNARGVPIAGYGGENDPQLAASAAIRDALAASGVPMKVEGLVTKAEGVDFLQVVGKGMGHKVDPASEEVLKSFRDARAARGINPRPGHVHLETYTLRYNRAHWVAIWALDEHYRKATVDAEVLGDEVLLTAANVRIVAVDRDLGETLTIDGRKFPLRSAVGGLLPQVFFRRTETGWETLDYETSRATMTGIWGHKRPGLQGPIDDAFTGPFLCVRGTGKPWHPAVHAAATTRLDRFAALWSRSMRGELPIKDDTDLTPADVDSSHLVAFGDPGSNLVISGALAGLPIGWTREVVTLGGKHEAATTLPALIAPNPANRSRYLVLNSGHTFGAEAFEGSNAMLYPRLADYAALRAADEGIIVSGFFDERWRQTTA